ncbi:MAG: sulfite exporter TauE/SafE family protein [Deferrisomatales bacterium]|nr:sulfite exporter TauE/SafE family protein [Deferrisomatales bacterium]
MTTTLVLVAIFFGVAVAFSALGQGGGAFYVPLLLAASVPFHQAAATSQAVIMAVSLSSLLIFHRAGFVDWKLVLLVEPATNLGALLGGYLSQYVPAQAGKLVFACVVVVAAFFMLRPLVEQKGPPRRGRAYWTRSLNGESYTVNWLVAEPLMAVAGFFAGMLGIGGGILKVPLMVFVCRIPLKVAVGSSSAMIGLTALTGFLGHGLAGHFDPGLTLPLAAAGFVGAQLGPRVSLAVDKRSLKRAFGVLMIAISAWMIVSVVRGA